MQWLFQKGDLNICDTWRGMDVVDKLLGRIIQECQQLIAESVLPGS